MVGISWSDDDASRPGVLPPAFDWQDAFYAELTRNGGTGAFQNFPDASLVDWRERYYGANLGRLMQVKAKYDPANLFRHGQSL